MDVSFIIITNGKKQQKLVNQIKSITNQNIKNYEIIVAGITDLNFNNNNIIYLKDEDKAKKGSLGGLRNLACSNAKYKNLVISDDDMLFSKDWYFNFQKYQEFDIITPRVKLPDGTRFWDNACYMSPDKGHMILKSNEKDDHLYMSGGQSWIMRNYVFDAVKWDENILIYSMKSLAEYNRGMHNEDTDYSLKCRENKFKITHAPNILVYHDDATYTSIGRVVRKREVNKDQKWCLSFNFHPDISYKFAIELFQYGYQAEGMDIMRKLNLKDNHFGARHFINEIENQFGGKLDDSEFTFDNIEYNNILN